MEQHENLCRAIKKLAWGYVLIHLHFNIGALDLLPDWCGYLLFLGALPVLGQSETTTHLLKPFGILLTVWNGIFWILKCGGISSIGYIPDLIVTIISLYFHFRLLTNIAVVAKENACPQENSILTLRTVRTVLIALFTLPLPWEEYGLLSILFVIINLIVVLCICSSLFSMHRYLMENPPKLTPSDSTDTSFTE